MSRFRGKITAKKIKNDFSSPKNKSAWRGADRRRIKRFFPAHFHLPPISAGRRASLRVKGKSDPASTLGIGDTFQGRLAVLQPRLGFSEDPAGWCDGRRSER
jgi:hypothetical protein